MKKAIVLAICVLMALPVISMAYEEKVEPNNDFSHATLLKESARGTVGFDDTKDIYRFYVAEGLEIRVELVGDNDVDLYLYNPEQQGVAYSCNEFYEYITYRADMTGYWYAEVTSARGNAGYTITATVMLGQHDGGYDTDAGNKILKSLWMFPMEPADDTPGRGMSGTLSPPGDKEDWYMFSTCAGQTISITITPDDDYDLELANSKAEVIASSTNSGTSAESISYVVPESGEYYMRIFAKDGAGEGNYTMAIDLQGENDGGQGKDAGGTIDNAMTITPGTYPGFLSYYDQVDWYAFSVSSGQGIHVEIESPRYNDYNLHLYDPEGNLVHSATYFGDDVLEYPADKSGTWKLKVDIFPGYGEEWDVYPVPIYKYGSGAYTLTLELGGSVSAPPVIPQPEIVPVAQTIVVTNDDTSNKDEYCYMAAVPAANYVEGGTRYVSPVVYEGDDTITNWFGTVDDTTDYLLEDWNEYLSHHDKEASVYTMSGDPVSAAADLAERAWESSSEAVVVVDGSGVTDEVTEVLSKSATLNVQTSVKQVRGDSDQLIEFEGNIAYPVFVGSKWGVMHVAFTEVKGRNYEAAVISPKYREDATDWWPEGEDKDDIWQPIILPGPYGIVTDSKGDFLISATLYSCDRYKIPVDSSDSTLSVTVETDEPSYLWVYLVDPKGNVVAPGIPDWSGAPIKPIHEWNGNKTVGDEQDYSYEVIEPHTTFTAEVHHPLTGRWTAIVVPRWDMSGSVSYTVKGEIRTYNPDRIAYGLSAANGAVEASLKHVPLLYTAPDSVPEETLRALNNLGVRKVTFVDLAGNDRVFSELAANYEVNRLTTMKEVANSIRALKSTNVLDMTADENYITITSFATGDGYYAPASYLAAYHGSPVVRIGEMGEAAHWAAAFETYEEYMGDWYHGCRSTGHAAKAGKPIMDYIKNGELPPIGWDQDLLWHQRMAEGFQEYIRSVGLDGEGKEYVGIVAPRADISMIFMRGITGNESTAGQLIGLTPAHMAAYIDRSVLYPAVIFGNPYRNYTTSSLMNFADGAQVSLNNGDTVFAYNGRNTKYYFSSFGRDYRGHVIWDNLLFEFNRGAMAYYYSGHGTGGSGVSGHPIWAGIGQETWHGYNYWTGDLPRKLGAWYDPEPPKQYDIVHFKWCDQLWENLHSMYVHFSSCTTAWHFAPDVYMSHGVVGYYGNCGSGIQGWNDAWDQEILKRAYYKGESLGDAISLDLWKFDRDYTTLDPTSIYGGRSLVMQSEVVYYGDPALILYSPWHWTEPIPVESHL